MDQGKESVNGIESGTVGEQLSKGDCDPQRSSPRRAPLTLNEIRLLAHRKWTAAGQPPGGCTRFWLEAEQELLSRK